MLVAVRTEIEDPSEFDVHGSCDGVLLVSHGWNLFAYNPATRRWACLPDNGNTIVGFYAHRPTGEFRELVQGQLVLVSAASTVVQLHIRIIRMTKNSGEPDTQRHLFTPNTPQKHGFHAITYPIF